VVEACAPGIAALVDRAGPVHAGTSDIGNSMTDGGFVLPDAVAFTNLDAVPEPPWKSG
jgi:hypothetical protein